MHTPRLRILTYNVHRCIGRDGKLMPERIADAIAELNPDVVALQELDVGCARTGHADQVSLIADALGMSRLFHPICRRGDELYGHALLSRHPLSLIRAAALPTLKRRVAIEPRGVLWASFDFAGRSVQVLTSHFGLFHRERMAQADALASPEWLSHPHCMLIVDDRFLTVGSANISNRSMGLDTELNIAWEALGPEDRSLAESIYRVRLNLLDEHCGFRECDGAAELKKTKALVPSLDKLIENGSCRLRRLTRDRILQEQRWIEPLERWGFYIDPDRPVIDDWLLGMQSGT